MNESNARQKDLVKASTDDPTGARTIMCVCVSGSDGFGDRVEFSYTRRYFRRISGLDLGVIRRASFAKNLFQAIFQAKTKFVLGRALFKSSKERFPISSEASGLESETRRRDSIGIFTVTDIHGSVGS